MAVPSESAGYVTRLFTLIAGSATQLVCPPTQAYSGEAARRLAHNLLVTFAVAAVLIAALMVWVDVPEIMMMPARGTPSLWPFRVLTDFGKDTYVLSLSVVSLLAVVLVAPAMREPLRTRLLGIGLHLQFLLLAVAAPLAVGELLKWIAGRGRPFVGGQANPFNFTPFAGNEAHASLPSAHTITACALAFAVAAIWPRLKGVMIAYALVIATTRLVLLAHHPSDVVAGAAIGILGASCVRYWFAVRGLGFAVEGGGLISPLPGGYSKGVAAGASAP